MHGWYGLYVVEAIHNILSSFLLLRIAINHRIISQQKPTTYLITGRKCKYYINIAQHYYLRLNASKKNLLERECWLMEGSGWKMVMFCVAKFENCWLFYVKEICIILIFSAIIFIIYQNRFHKHTLDASKCVHWIILYKLYLIHFITFDFYIVYELVHTINQFYL